MTPETDAEVIAGSLEAPERFETIFDRHASSIHRYLRRRVAVNRPRLVYGRAARGVVRSPTETTSAPSR